MAVENGEWIMRGANRGEPARIRSWEALTDWIEEVGFLPLFRNEIEGFSAEERTCPLDWWTGDPAQSRALVFQQVQAHFPATDKALRAVLGGCR